MLVSYAYKYASLFVRGGVISFTYNKNHEGLDIDPSGTPQFMVLLPKIHRLMKRKKLCEIRIKPFCFI